MTIPELIRSIHPICINRAVQNIAVGGTMRDDFRAQIERYFTAFVQSLDTGDPGSMDEVLLEWAASSVQHDYEDQPNSVLTLLSRLMQITTTVARETLKPRQAVDLLNAMTPYWGYAFEKAAVYENVAQAKTAEVKLSETRKNSERLNQSKSRFIRVAAQELKTPLTLVEGYAAMLQDLFSQEEDPQAVTLLNGLAGGTRRLRTIINELIDVSIVDNDLLAIQFEPAWISRILSKLYKELSGDVEAREQYLEICEFDGVREVIAGDPERLEQAFRNILANAIKFTPAGGHIRVDGRKLPGFIEVTVADTGVGIDPEEQASIFDAFGKLGDDQPVSCLSMKTGSGPGLGLHISKGIIEAHGGTLWVESPGHNEITCPGSTFHILLPVANEPMDETSANLLKLLSRGNYSV